MSPRQTYEETEAENRTVDNNTSDNTVDNIVDNAVDNDTVDNAVINDIAAFVQDVLAAMGVTLSTTIEETPDGARINLEGEDGGLLIRRDAEGLQALQHVVATAFRRQLGDQTRIVVDCNGFRKDKDAELRTMAHFMAQKAGATGEPQEMGPLNPYERRIVHIAVAEIPAATSESIGDAFMKTVIINVSK